MVSGKMARISRTILAGLIVVTFLQLGSAQGLSPKLSGVSRRPLATNSDVQIGLGSGFVGSLLDASRNAFLLDNQGGLRSEDDDSVQVDSSGGVPQKYNLYFRFMIYAGRGRFTGELADAFRHYGTLSIGFGVRYKRISIDITGDICGAALEADFVGRLKLEDDLDSTAVRLMNRGVRIGFCVLSTRILRIKPIVGLTQNGFKERLADKPDFVDKFRTHHQLGVEADIYFAKSGKFRGAGSGAYHNIYVALNYTGWNLDSIDFGKGNLLALHVGYLLEVGVF